MKDQFIHTECSVRAEMHAMGLTESQSLAIVKAFQTTFEARAWNKTPPRKIAAELLWIWATGLAASAENVYKES